MVTLVHYYNYSTLSTCSSLGVPTTDTVYEFGANMREKVPSFCTGMLRSGRPDAENRTSRLGSWDTVERSRLPDTWYNGTVRNSW